MDDLDEHFKTRPATPGDMDGDERAAADAWLRFCGKDFDYVHEVCAHLEEASGSRVPTMMILVVNLVRAAMLPSLLSQPTKETRLYLARSVGETIASALASAATPETAVDHGDVHTVEFRDQGYRFPHGVYSDSAMVERLLLAKDKDLNALGRLYASGVLDLLARWTKDEFGRGRTKEEMFEVTSRGAARFALAALGLAVGPNDVSDDRVAQFLATFKMEEAKERAGFAKIKEGLAELAKTFKHFTDE